jgi:hypothetical protein
MFSFGLKPASREGRPENIPTRLAESKNSKDAAILGKDHGAQHCQVPRDGIPGLADAPKKLSIRPVPFGANGRKRK